MGAIELQSIPQVPHPRESGLKKPQPSHYSKMWMLLLLLLLEKDHPRSNHKPLTMQWIPCTSGMRQLKKSSEYCASSCDGGWNICRKILATNKFPGVDSKDLSSTSHFRRLLAVWWSGALWHRPVVLQDLCIRWNYHTTLWVEWISSRGYPVMGYAYQILALPVLLLWKRLEIRTLKIVAGVRFDFYKAAYAGLNRF